MSQVHMKSGRTDSAWMRLGWRVRRWMGRMVVCLALFVMAGQVSAQTVEYIHTDALGSPVAVTNAAGEVVERQVYEPYGTGVTRGPNDGPGFTGHVEDSATGLDYMQQRYYDPELGLFASPDPAGQRGVESFNRYRYGNSSPYSFVDPDGRQSWSITGSSNVGPAVDTACKGDVSCQREVAKGLISSEILIVSLLVPDPSDLFVAGAITRFVRIGRGASLVRGMEEVGELARAEGGAVKLTSSSGQRTEQISMQGGERAAKKWFDRSVGSSRPVGNGGRLGTMADGTRVQMSTRVEIDGSVVTSVRFSYREVGSRITRNLKLRFKE